MDFTSASIRPHKVVVPSVDVDRITDAWIIAIEGGEILEYALVLVGTGWELCVRRRETSFVTDTVWNSTFKQNLGTEPKNHLEFEIAN